MARGYYTVQHGSQCSCCKMWFLASAALIIFLLVLVSILTAPFFMKEDTGTFDALENHPELSITSVIKTHSSDTDSTTRSTTTFDDRKKMQQNPITQHSTSNTEIPITRSYTEERKVASEESSSQNTVIQDFTTITNNDSSTSESKYENSTFKEIEQNSSSSPKSPIEIFPISTTENTIELLSSTKMFSSTENMTEMLQSSTRENTIEMGITSTENMIEVETSTENTIRLLTSTKMYSSTENMTEMLTTSTENMIDIVSTKRVDSTVEAESSTEILNKIDVSSITETSLTVEVDTESEFDHLILGKWNTSLKFENSTQYRASRTKYVDENSTKIVSHSLNSTDRLNVDTKNSTEISMEETTVNENATKILISSSVNTSEVETTTVMNESYTEKSTTTSESFLTSIEYTEPEFENSTSTETPISTDEISTTTGDSVERNTSDVPTSPTTEKSYTIPQVHETITEEFNKDGSDSMDSTETESCTEYNPSGLKKCTSRYCKKETSSMLYKMNFMTDKCQNFYDYACGNMRTMHQEDELATVWNTIKREITKIDESRPLIELDLKRFYSRCAEQTNSDHKLSKDAGRNLITSIGTINNDFYTVDNLTDIIIFLIQMNSFPLFDISLEIDKSYTSRLSITVSPPLQDGISLLFDVYNEKERRCIEESTPDRESSQDINLKNSYHNYRECKQNHSAYISAIMEALTEFELIDDSTDMDSITGDMEMIITEIFESGPDSITLEKKKSSYDNQVLTVGELRDVFNGSINWEELFNSIVNSTIDSNTEIHVYGLDYFKIIGEKLMEERELWKLQNFLLANFAQNIFEYFFKVKSECNRESYCLEVASRLMPDVVSNLYLRSFSKKDLKQAHKSTMDTLHLIRESMVRELKNESNAVLDKEESRQNLLEKVEAFTVSLPSELEFSSENVLDMLHPSFIETDLTEYPYLEQAAFLISRSQLLKFSTYNMQPDSPQVIWLLFAKSFSTKSVYLYPLNKLAVPQVLIAENHRIRMLPAAIKVARLGHVISRGLVASFDTIGCQFDSTRQYTVQFQCDKMLIGKAKDTFSFNLMTAQSMGFEQTYVEDGITYTFTPRGALSIEERISDVSATFLALEALKNLNATELTTLPWGDMTYQQVFFIAVAQTFCSKMSFFDTFPSLFEKKTLTSSYDGVLPPSLRVMQMMSHSEEFVSSFKCKSGSTMDATMKLDPFPFRTYESDY